MGRGRIIGLDGYTVACYKDGIVYADFNSSTQLGSYKNGNITVGYGYDTDAKYSDGRVEDLYPNNDTLLYVEYGSVYARLPDTSSHAFFDPVNKSHRIGSYNIESGNEDEVAAAAYIAFKKNRLEVPTSESVASGGGYSQRVYGGGRAPSKPINWFGIAIFLMVAVVLVVFVYGRYMKKEEEAKEAYITSRYEDFWGKDDYTDGIDYSGDQIIGSWVCIDARGLDSYLKNWDIQDELITFYKDGTVDGVLVAWYENGNGMVFCTQWAPDNGRYKIGENSPQFMGDEYYFVITFSGNYMYIYDEEDSEQQYTTWMRV